MNSMATKFHWQIAICVVLFAGISCESPRRVSADQIPAGWEASNMKPIGYSDLGGHEAFKMAIKHVGDHWYLYMGHFVANGWSIVDVTDPTEPKVVKFIPGPTPTSAGQIDLHGNLMITALQDRAGYGGDPNKRLSKAFCSGTSAIRWVLSNSPGGRQARPARIVTPIPAANTRIYPLECRVIKDKFWSSSMSAIRPIQKKQGAGG